MIKLGIIFGGRSGEHDVSLMSATSVIRALGADKYQIIPIGITRKGEWMTYTGPAEGMEDGSWEKTGSPLNPGDLKKVVDFAFPILHGPFGEDGTIQGLFEMLGVPYAGCGVLASSMAMDKGMAKVLFADMGLPICKHMVVLEEQVAKDETAAIDRVEAHFSGKYPLFVKPANMGSSVGVTKAKTREGLFASIREALQYDRRLVIEEGLDCREIETAILGNESPEAACVGEIIPSAEFYDYKAKYFDGGKSKICVPADIGEDITEKIRALAIKAYQSLDCAGFARVDFFLENGTDRIYINEINTIPGFTKFSMFPLLWQEAGLTYSRLLERIVELGYERHYAKDHRQAAFL